MILLVSVDRTALVLTSLMLLLVVSGLAIIGQNVQINNLNAVLNHENITVSTTTIESVVTTTATQNLTSEFSRELSLNSVLVYDVGYIVEGGRTYTHIYLLVPDGKGMNVCCDVYLFDGAVQGVPLGQLVNIGYREYTENYIKHMVVTSIEALNK